MTGPGAGDPRHSPVLGVLWMAAASLFFSVAIGFVRHLSDTYTTFEIAFFRQALGIVVASFWVWRVGLVVDDREAVRRALAEAGVKLLGKRLNFHDPWGNRIEIVSYDSIQFTKADHVLRGMGLGDIEKTPDAIAELAEKGMAPG